MLGVESAETAKGCCILVLNYRGRAIMERCLPSVLAAAAAAPAPCPVVVIDNDSQDDSVHWLRRTFPEVAVEVRPNRGLASFNDVLAERQEPFALLLNNDIRLETNAIAPLTDALRDHPDAWFSAPRCYGADGVAYEGMRTRVRMRRGLVQGCCRVPGHEAWISRSDKTAASGPVLMVDRLRFLAVGGYDPIYFPGRIEDLDLGFRGYMAGWAGYYAPDSVAYHEGFATFGPAFGERGNDKLALRNTLIFCWKSLTGPRLAAHACWLPARIMLALLRGRWDTLSAMADALARLPETLRQRRLTHNAVGAQEWSAREAAFFREFAW